MFRSRRRRPDARGYRGADERRRRVRVQVAGDEPVEQSGALQGDGRSGGGRGVDAGQGAGAGRVHGHEVEC